jgi:type IV pilus assembly protein PilM
MPQSELDSADKWQASKNLPIKIEDVKLDWQVINSPKSTSEPFYVMIIAAPIERVRKIAKLIKEADLNLVSIETSTVATSRSVANFPGANIMVIDIGAVSTEMSLVKNKVLMYSRSITLGGEFLSKSVAKGLGLDSNQADQFKRKFGVTLDKLEGKVYRSLKPVLAMIVDEVQRSMEYISKQYGLKIDLIVLSGGSAKLPEINNFFEHTFNIKTQVANPWENIVYPAGVQQDIMFSAPDYSVAVGLALREGK